MIKNLKSLFVIDDEKPSEDKSTDKKGKDKDKTSGVKEDKASKSGQTDQPTELSEGKVDEKILDALFKALEDNNLEGFDYFEFKKSLNTLEKMMADEATRFKSAFATASTMGLTLDKLLETAKHYLGILDSERAKFNNAAKSQRQAMVDQRKQELEQLKKTIEEKRAKILEYTTQIKTYEGSLKDLEASITSAVDKIAETQQNFERSFENLKSQIDLDMEKMKKYLK